MTFASVLGVNGLCKVVSWKGSAIGSIDGTGIYKVVGTPTDGPAQVTTGMGDMILFLFWDSNTAHTLYFCHNTGKVYYGHVVYGSISWSEL